jgi:hypothetical protein
LQFLIDLSRDDKSELQQQYSRAGGKSHVCELYELAGAFTQIDAPDAGTGPFPEGTFPSEITPSDGRCYY